MTGNLSAGFDAVSQDFKTVVWRIKELGFNAIRLPVSFSHFAVRHTYQQAPASVLLLQSSKHIYMTALLATACMHGA